MLLLVLQPAQALLLLETETLWDGAAPELALVSVILNGRDLRRDVIIAFDPQTTDAYVDIKAISAALDLAYTEDDGELSLTTPIGVARLPRHLLRRLDEHLMVSLAVLENRLASDFMFSSSDYAVRVDVPWPLSQAPAAAEVIKPTGSSAGVVDAPRASVSFLRTEYLHRFERGEDTDSIITDTGGRLFNGFWQTRVRDYLDDDPFFEDYTWLQAGRHHRLLLGNQTLSLDPLLQGFEFTGAQAAWTNRPVSLFTGALQNEQLISNQRGSIRTFVGDGPPGGRAELRIEGSLVARTIISLDGRYEFRDVELPAGGVVEVEAWLFERGEEGAPSSIERFSGYNTNRVLPEQTLLLQAGAGVDGNLIEDVRGDLREAGFFNARYAPWDSLTVQAMYQRVNGIDGALTGVSVNLDRLGFISAQVAYAGNDHAWRVELENLQDDWFWRGFAQSEPDGWFGREGELDNVFGEFGYQVGTQWRLSLVGRDFENNQESFDYLLPAVEWRPSTNLMLRARPDFDGDYTGQAFWRINRRHTVNALINEAESSLQWIYDLPDRDSLLVQVLDRQDLGQRVAAIYRHGSAGLGSLGWALGVLANDERAGYLAQAYYEFIPGLRARAEAFRDPFSGVLGRAETVVSLSVVANFNLAGGRLGRGYYRRQQFDQGLISGRIEVPPAFADDFDVSGVAIMVDGQVRTRSEDDGRFTLPFLRPGIYRVKLDLDGLPLELQPRQDQYWVEVAAGAASFVRFETDVLLGFAGRLTNSAGCPLAAVALEVLDDQGHRLQQTRTSSFGYYRVDQLPPGRYTVRPVNSPEQRRAVDLRDNFLFNQDLSIAGAADCGEE
ncbi:MAG: hypothetical protein Tsb002_09660 [Wenzhouxiangellaceae bacterium]